MRKKSLFYAAYTITKIVKQNLSSLKKNSFKLFSPWNKDWNCKSQKISWSKLNTNKAQMSYYKFKVIHFFLHLNNKFYSKSQFWLF